ncbi:MAG: ATP-binding cassette domain-containing protein [bacterium]|nr:ATP-binding cassette domain-containing protein [bacterium]
MNIRADELTFRYPNSADLSPLFDDLTLSLFSGECVALIGPSGSGKSTLAQHLNGLLKPESGRLWVDDRVFGWSKSDLRRLRERVGLVFQFPESQIFEATVFAEVAFAARKQHTTAETLRQSVARALGIVGLKFEDFADRNPLRLSGGERRLISIASLLVTDPDWLILDEPTLGLDLHHRACIAALIKQRKESQRSVLLITHDLDLALQVCPRSLVLGRGKLLYDGPTVPLFFYHDLSSEYGLMQPSIIPIWKGLKAYSDSSELDENHILPTAIALEHWIKTQIRSKRQDLQAVLQQFEPKMDQVENRCQLLSLSRPPA